MRTVMRWAAVAAALVLAQPLASQVVRGRVVEYRTGYPVGLARVTVLDEAGQPVGYGQSDGWGEFTIRLQRAGRVFIRAELVGYRSATSAMSDVEEGDEVYRVLALRRGNPEIEGGDLAGGGGFGPRTLLGPARGRAATDTRPATSGAVGAPVGGKTGPAAGSADAPGRRAEPRPAPAAKPRGEEQPRTSRPARPASRGGGVVRRPARL